MPPSTTGQSITERAQNGAVVDPQEGLFDHEIADEALEALLDKREDAKAKRGRAQKAFKDEDDKVRARLSEFELGDGEVARVGKYRIAKRALPGRSVSFETSPSSRLYISLFE